jgi:hypothetical protein
MNIESSMSNTARQVVSLWAVSSSAAMARKALTTGNSDARALRPKARVPRSKRPSRFRTTQPRSISTAHTLDSELFGTPSKLARSLRVRGASATRASSTDTAVWMPGERRPLA